jgi:galactokinase
VGQHAIDDPARLERIRALFRERFGNAAPFLFRAPGRVNLIGEHTDYNEGYVLPAAIDRDAVMAASPRPDRQVRLYSANLDAGFAFALDDIQHDAEQTWSNYPRGVAWALEERGLRLAGLDAVIESTVPLGGGLSSSAALEVATAIAFQSLAGFEMAPEEMARVCQKAENDFVGMPCGIMDQFIACLGRRDHALLIDCRSLAYEHVPLGLTDHALVVVDTGVRRELAASEYRVRRRECEQGAALLRAVIPQVRSLRDLSPADLERHRKRLPEVIYRRCRHVVTENARVLESVAALRRHDLEAFGRLMWASHESLRDDYEVSCGELDLLVKIARSAPGVLGSRMVGGGFGGCTVTLAARPALAAFREATTARYTRETGREPRITVCAVTDGAGPIGA